VLLIFGSVSGNEWEVVRANQELAVITTVIAMGVTAYGGARGLDGTHNVKSSADVPY